MAEAKGHRFGQALGEWCEKAIEPLLQECADRHSLYLDKKGSRAARKGKKVRWIDSYGNTHDLDYVFERGGSGDRIGTPVAFIESAWRRYTKHSRNKAQEIQGAVLPVRDRHHFSAPFVGCFLAGVYTAAAREQLKSLGFHILYFEYISIIEAFRRVGIDVSFDETTSDEEFARKQDAWKRLTTDQRIQVWDTLLELNRGEVDAFITALEQTLSRQIALVRVVPLHGLSHDCRNVDEAIEFVREYDDDASSAPLLKYEVQIRYDNGDEVDGQFHDREALINFLAQYRTGHWLPVLDTDQL